jgi:predicted ATPase
MTVKEMGLASATGWAFLRLHKRHELAPTSATGQQAMYISNIVIRNFRALEDIHCDLGQRINVLVGPNAVGKTSVLQALRLVKALLAARSQNEAQQTLISLGAASPHFQQRTFLGALARDVTKPIEIRSTYCLTEAEIGFVDAALSDVIRGIVLSRVGQSFANPTVLVQFLDGPQGRLAIEQAQAELKPHLEKLRRDRTLLLGVTIDVKSGRIEAFDPLAGTIIGFLDQRLPPNASIFSYFPADRALPFGETPIQLGAADSQQQIESHNAQPQLKYTRMKNMIFNTIVMGESHRQSIMAEFEKIFTGILRGRKIDVLGINELGMLSVMTEEIDTKRKVEIDNLSSGEKNLVLTFLLIANAVSNGGIVLFDEPELHLNPAVCREMLDFMMREYAKPQDIQFIICTHSPEILSGAFSNDDCSLYHIKSASLITKVARRALDEYSDALQKLGTSVSETLLYEGTVLVEGDDDVAFLEIGFTELLKRYKVKDRGGRREVEKTAKQIQDLEAKGEKVAPIFIILDKDDEITDLRNSDGVRILQWPRRCMENYLIDLDVITELLKQSDVARTPITSQGEVDRILRELAFNQLNGIVAIDTYQTYGYKNPSLWAEDVEKKPIPDIATALFMRLSTVKASLNFSDQASWEKEFTEKCETKKKDLELTWEAKWKELCDGKLLFNDLQKSGALRIGVSVFKRRIIQNMKATTSENWRLVESLVKGLLDKSSG